MPMPLTPEVLGRISVAGTKFSIGDFAMLACHVQKRFEITKMVVKRCEMFGGLRQIVTNQSLSKNGGKEGIA